MLIGNAPEGPVLLMLPRTDYRIDDTWFVVGLRGSRSKDIVVDGAFVPHHRAVSMNDVREGCTPGRAIHDTPNYRIPMRSILSFTLSASVLGMAQGGLEVFSGLSRGRSRGVREGNSPNRWGCS
jgi:3-hydroxy-9,10-secoandrosta-1,3,5(10)-triene-9,17-dione monooxygenase